MGYDVIKQNKIKHKGTTAKGTEMGTDTGETADGGQDSADQSLFSLWSITTTHLRPDT